MQPIEFIEAIKKIPAKEVEISTLGGKSKFKIKVIKNLIQITNSKNRHLKINKIHWDKVMKRMKDLPEDQRGMASRYGSGNHLFNWTECPNRVFSIYIPAIIKYLHKCTQKLKN